MTLSVRPSTLSQSKGANSWALADVATRKFGPRPQFAGMRSMPLRLAFWLVLATADRRTNETGTAVCCLSGVSRRPKVLGALAAMAAVVMLGGMWVTARVTWPLWISFLIAGWLYWPMVRTGFSGLAAHRALRRFMPKGKAVTVHTVASVVPGEGQRLLETVMMEADKAGWMLVLEAANERLAVYYGQFGFVATGPAVGTPWGESSVAMARPPRTTRVVGNA